MYSVGCLSVCLIVCLLFLAVLAAGVLSWDMHVLYKATGWHRVPKAEGITDGQCTPFLTGPHLRALQAAAGMPVLKTFA